MHVRSAQETKRVVITAGAMVAAAVISGCAGFQMLPVDALEPASPIPYASILVEVKPAVAEDVSGELTDLEFAVVKGLQELEGLDKVELAHEGSVRDRALLIRLTMSHVRKVSGTSRFFLGALAGKAAVGVTVEFFDASDMRPIGEYKITGKSGGTGMSGGTDDAVKKTAEAVVQLVSETYSLSKPEHKGQKKSEIGA